jgi:predicted GNAT superfamily acetyltransferase
MKVSGRGNEAFCEDWKIDLGVKNALVEIPTDVVALKSAHPDEGLRWREATREVFQAYFRAGYAAVALLGGKAGLRYLLCKPKNVPPNIFAQEHANSPHARRRRSA